MDDKDAAVCGLLPSTPGRSDSSMDDKDHHSQRKVPCIPYGSDSSMDDKDQCSGGNIPNFKDVQIPLWTIRTGIGIKLSANSLSSDSSMDDKDL